MDPLILRDLGRPIVEFWPMQKLDSTCPAILRIGQGAHTVLLSSPQVTVKSAGVSLQIDGLTARCDTRVGRDFAALHKGRRHMLEWD